MALTPSTGATAANIAIQGQIDRLANGEALLDANAIAVELAAAYHDYAKTGTLPGGNLAAGGNQSILEAAFVADNTSGMAAQLAQGLCDFWATCITTGTPAHGGSSVVSVVVDAATVQASMEAAIQGLITDQAQPDGWLRFYQDLQSVVQTIPCTVTELMPGSPPAPQAFPETIQ